MSGCTVRSHTAAEVSMAVKIASLNPPRTTNTKKPAATSPPTAMA
jgi:hypothetical protein